MEPGAGFVCGQRSNKATAVPTWIAGGFRRAVAEGLVEIGEVIGYRMHGPIPNETVAGMEVFFSQGTADGCRTKK